MATVDVPYREINQLDIEGHHIVFAHPTEDAGELALPTELSTVDWKTGEQRHLHSNHFRDGQTGYPALEDGWVLFTDEDREPEAIDLRTQWRLYAIPLEGGEERRVLAESPEKETSWAPLPLGNAGRFAYSVQEDPAAPREGARQYEWEPNGEPHVVRRRVRLDMFAPLPESRWAVTEPTKHPGTELLWGSEAYIEDDSGQRTRLTEHGWVQGFDANGEVIAWGERKVQPDGEPHPRSAARYVWMTRADDPDPVMVHEGWHGGVAAGGAGFVAFFRGDSGAKIQVTWPGKDEPEPVSEGNFLAPAGFEVDDDLIVYATKRKGGVRIHVVRVTPPE